MEINEPLTKTSLNTPTKTFLPIQQNVIPKIIDKILKHAITKLKKTTQQQHLITSIPQKKTLNNLHKKIQ